MSDTLSGFLLWADSNLIGSAVGRLQRLTVLDAVAIGWNSFEYVVDHPISGVESEDGPPFHYRLYMRWGGDRFIVLSNNYRICNHFLENDLRGAVQGGLKKAEILVHDLVVEVCAHIQDLMKLPSSEPQQMTKSVELSEQAEQWLIFNRTYAIGYGFARSDAFSGNLQKIEFEGDDLSQASLFLNAIPFLRFRNCRLRQRAIDDRGFPSSFELVRLGRRAFVSFSIPSGARSRNERFKDVEVVLRLLNKLGYIK